MTTDLTPIESVDTYRRFQQDDGIHVITGFFAKPLQQAGFYKLACQRLKVFYLTGVCVVKNHHHIGIRRNK